MDVFKIRYILLSWAAVALCAVLNGTFRFAVLQPALGETAARMVSCFMLISILLAVTYLLMRRTELRFSASELKWMGLAWLALTIAFEFGFGHYVVGNSWDKLLIDYDIAKGRIWVLVLVFIALAPTIVGRNAKSEEKGRREEQSETTE